MLSVGKVNAIGVVPPTDEKFSWVFSDPYTREFLRGVAQICEDNGAAMSLLSARDYEGGSGLRKAVVDGLILSTMAQADMAEPALRQKVPMVVMDAAGGPDLSSVKIDDRAAARLLTRHFLSLGHRKFAILSIKRRNIAPVMHPPGRDGTDLQAAYTADQERLDGVSDALKEYGLALNDMAVIESCPTIDEDEQFGTNGACILLNAGFDFTAILSMAAIPAIAVLEELNRRGVRVPEDLSIGTIDDPPEAAHANPPLTVVAQSAVDKGRAAAQILFEDGGVQHVTLPVELIVRKSCAVPRTRGQPALAQG
jgi:DNA-binding LacI/PurR family transcriptional regulator